MPATLTTTEIVSDIIAAFRVYAPVLSLITTDFTSEGVKKGKTYTAHVAQMPTTNSFDAAKGYGHADNAQEAKNLFADISVTISNHEHVDINISYLASISDQKEVYQEAIDNAAIALAKSVSDSVLAKIVAANFKKTAVETAANHDRDTLGTARKELNKNGANPMGRFGIMGSDAFEALAADPRIESKDFAGQGIGGEAYGSLTNVSGFQRIIEYPDFPTAENLTSFFGCKEAFVLKTGLPDDIKDIAADLGIPAIASYEEVTDPDTGLTLLAIKHQVPGTLQLVCSLTLMWGITAGADGGAADAGTDQAGFRFTSA